MTKNINPLAIKARCIYVREKIMKASPAKAAIAMGYRNTSQISKMENARRCKDINQKYLFNLANWAGISLDYLYGRTDEYELCKESVHSVLLYHKMRETIEEHSERYAKMFATFVNDEQIGWRIELINEDFEAFKRSFERFRELNSSFDDMRGGAKFLLQMDKLEREIQSAMLGLKRVKQREALRVKRLESALEQELNDEQIDFVGYEKRF